MEKEASSTKKLVVRQPGERINVSRFHAFADCSKLREGANGKLEEVSDREAELLGLKACSVCERRATGGPAIDVLEGFFGEDWPFPPYTDEGTADELAWKLKEYLAERGFYLAQRRKEQA